MRTALSFSLYTHVIFSLGTRLVLWLVSQGHPPGSSGLLQGRTRGNASQKNRKLQETPRRAFWAPRVAEGEQMLPVPPAPALAPKGADPVVLSPSAPAFHSLLRAHELCPLSLSPLAPCTPAPCPENASEQARACEHSDVHSNDDAVPPQELRVCGWKGNGHSGKGVRVC